MNIFKLFYRKALSLMGRLHVYEERTDKYLGHLKQYVNGANIVVDVGCGRGTFSRALACEERLVIALDLERRLLEEIQDLHIEKVCADAHHLPFRDGSVDCVLSLTSRTSHKSRERGERTPPRVKKGGTAIIQLPNLQYPFEPHTKFPLLSLLPRKLQLTIFRAMDYAFVNMKVTIKSALSMFSSASLDVKETVKIYHLGIMKLLPLAPSYIFITKKEHAGEPREREDLRS